jgi:hypothetical protein
VCPTTPRATRDRSPCGALHLRRSRSSHDGTKPKSLRLLQAMNGQGCGPIHGSHNRRTPRRPLQLKEPAALSNCNFRSLGDSPSASAPDTAKPKPYNECSERILAWAVAQWPGKKGKLLYDMVTALCQQYRRTNHACIMNASLVHRSCIILSGRFRATIVHS